MKLTLLFGDLRPKKCGSHLICPHKIISCICERYTLPHECGQCRILYITTFFKRNGVNTYRHVFHRFNAVRFETYALNLHASERNQHDTLMVLHKYAKSNIHMQQYASVKTIRDRSYAHNRPHTAVHGSEASSQR